MAPPRRIQLRRTRGWRLPPNAVVVSRPSKWGNPFDWREALAEWGGSPDEARAAVVGVYRDWLTMAEPERFPDHLRARRVAILASLHALRGRPLACWCAPDAPCHADVLIEIANR